MICLCCEMLEQLSNLLRVLFLWLRYRAVASWSRVQGVGIPLFTAIEIFTIWVLSIILAVPEAVVFNMITFTYNNQTIRTCMLKPESNFMTVRFNRMDVMPTSFPFAHINTQTLCNKQCILSGWPQAGCYARFLWSFTNFDPESNILCKSQTMQGIRVKPLSFLQFPHARYLEDFFFFVRSKEVNW